MYSLQILEKLIEELYLKLEDNYDKKDKYISTTKFNLKCTFDGCNEKTRIKFDALLRSKKAYCKEGYTKKTCVK